MEKMLTVSSSPHVRAKHTTKSIMLDVIIALMPTLVAGIYFYGIRALLVTTLSVICCVVFEWGWEKIFKRPSTIGDLSAVVTGVLLAFNMPVGVPVYAIVVGAFIAIIFAKQIFGGMGQNFVNPALAGRAALLAAYPTAMRTFTVPIPGKFVADAVTGATPLELMKNELYDQMPTLFDAFVGNIGGCIGEASALALLIGGIYLLTLIFGGVGVTISFMSLFLGGVMLGAFFMATDYTTTPMTIKGQIIFAIGAGIITVVIRLWGGYPEGVSYSILLMNLTVPLIDRYIKQKRFGGGKVA